MNSFQKYLKDNIKKFDILSFINYIKLLDIHDISEILFIPNISLISHSSLFEDIIFDEKITVLLNYPISHKINDFLYKTQNKEVINIFSNCYNFFFSKIFNRQIGSYTQENFNFNYFFYLIKNIFLDYEIDIKPAYNNLSSTKNNLLKLGDKLPINKKCHFYNIYIYSDENISKKDFYTKYKQSIIMLRKFIDFKIIFLISDYKTSNYINLPFQLSAKQQVVF